MSQKNLNNKSTIEERVCKKCGSPLRSTNRYNCCDNCRRERAKKIRSLMEICLSVGVISLSIVPKVTSFVKKK